VVVGCFGFLIDLIQWAICGGLATVSRGFLPQGDPHSVCTGGRFLHGQCD
jgi:hypothetical protein